MSGRLIQFKPDALQDQEREQLIAKAKEEFDNLFKIIKFSSASGFATKVRSSARTTRAIVCSSTEITATIPELAEVFSGDHVNAAVGFAQSQLIYSLLKATPRHPYRSCGMRWSLWHSPTKMIRQRDIVYLEYADEFVDEHGRRGWARCTVSIDHRSCRPLTHSHNIVRATLGCCGTTYTETDEPGVMQAITFYDCDTKGVPAWMTKIVANRKAKNPHNLAHVIRLNRISTSPTDKVDIMFPPNVNVCHGCYALLSQRKWLSRNKYRKCRECGEMLCKACCNVVYCATEGQKKLDRICVHCVDNFLALNGRIEMYTDATYTPARTEAISGSSSSGSSWSGGGKQKRFHIGATPKSRSYDEISQRSATDSGETMGPESPTPILGEPTTPEKKPVSMTATVNVDLSYLNSFRRQASAV